MLASTNRTRSKARIGFSGPVSKSGKHAGWEPLTVLIQHRENAAPVGNDRIVTKPSNASHLCLLLQIRIGGNEGACPLSPCSGTPHCRVSDLPARIFGPRTFCELNRLAKRLRC